MIPKPKRPAHRKVRQALLLDDLCSDLIHEHIYKHPYAGFDGPRTNYERIVIEFRCQRPGAPSESPDRIAKMVANLTARPRDLDAEKKVVERVKDDHAKALPPPGKRVSEKEFIKRQRGASRIQPKLPSSADQAKTFQKLVQALTPQSYSPPLTSELRHRFDESRSHGLVLELLEHAKFYAWSLLNGLECSIRVHTSQSIVHSAPVVLPDSLMRALAIEGTSNPSRLKEFLTAVITRWREHDAPRSKWRFRSVVHEQASWQEHDDELTPLILKRLQSLGIVPPDKILSKEGRGSFRRRIQHCLGRELSSRRVAVK